MTVWVIIAGSFSFAFVVAVAMYVTRRSPLELGGPTPEQARVRIDEAAKKPEAEAEAAAEEIRHAPLDDKIARARDIAARGKLRGDGTE